MTTVFGKIIRGQLPCEKVYEDEEILVIKDIHPVAPIHFLIIPKKEIANLQAMQPEDYYLLEKVVHIAQKLAEEYDIVEGYRLLTNSGPEAGQTVFHLHFHLIGGRRLDRLA